MEGFNGEVAKANAPDTTAGSSACEQHSTMETPMRRPPRIHHQLLMLIGALRCWFFPIWDTPVACCLGCQEGACG